LPHLAEVLQVGAAAKEGEADEETHLYLTDYRSLYVADTAGSGSGTSVAWWPTTPSPSWRHCGSSGTPATTAILSRSTEECCSSR
jgi:hypothetical protein